MTTRENKKIIDKTFDFTMKFNSFIVQNPDIAKKIPNNSFIVFRDDSDREFTRVNEKLAKDAIKRGETSISATLQNKSWKLEKLITV